MGNKEKGEKTPGASITTKYTSKIVFSPFPHFPLPLLCLIYLFRKNDECKCYDCSVVLVAAQHFLDPHINKHKIMKYSNILNQSNSN